MWEHLLIIKCPLVCVTPYRLYWCFRSFPQVLGPFSCLPLVNLDGMETSPGHQSIGVTTDQWITDQ